MVDPMVTAITEHRLSLEAQASMSEHAAKRDQAVREAAAAGHTQADIARALGVDPARINRIVKGG